jgi:hypothetical protein
MDEQEQRGQQKKTADADFFDTPLQIVFGKDRHTASKHGLKDKKENFYENKKFGTVGHHIRHPVH